MHNLVADFVRLQRPLPLVAAPIENERQTIPEAQPGVVLVVHAPRPAVTLVLVRFAETDRVTTDIVDLSSQLSPGQHETKNH